MNLDSSSCIFMTTVKEVQCRIVAENRIKQDEVKENSQQSNSVKRAACIIKQGGSYDNIISAVANLLSATNTTVEFTDSILQSILPLSYDTLKCDFIHMGGNISDFTDLKKQIVSLEIERRWGKDIIKEGARKFPI